MSHQLYRHFDSSSALLYVGISLSSLLRLVAHKNMSPWFQEISSITIEHFQSKFHAGIAEVRAIRQEKPKYNQRGVAKPAPQDTPVPLEYFQLKQKQAAEPRRKRAAALREAGETWAEIGRILGVSHQRARQLAMAYSANGSAKRSSKRAA